MSYPARWSFWLCRSSDMKVIAPIAPSKKTAKSFSLDDIGLCRIGVFRCDLHIDSKAAMSAQPDSTCVRADRLAAGSTVPRTIWSGFVQPISTNLSAEVVSITAIGWYEEANQRNIRFADVADGSLVFVDEIGGDIGKALIDKANLQDDSSGAVRPMHLSFGSRTDTQVRTRSFEAGGSYGSAIDSLSQIENGYDWIVDPILRTISFRAPEDYVDHTNVHYVYGRNVDDPVVLEDGTRNRNRLTLLGANGLIVVVDDPEAIDRAGGKIIDETISLSSVTSSQTLQEFGKAELSFKSSPPVIITFKPKPFEDSPRPYDEFEWGDSIYTTIKRGRVDVQRQKLRAFSGKYGFTDQGDEIISEITVALS